MPIVFKTQPSFYNAGYSAIPLRVFEDTWTTYEDFKWIVNILYDKVFIADLPGVAVPVSIDGQIYTQITTSTAHNFSVGDVLFMNNPFDIPIGYYGYTGYYIVKSIVSSTEFVIDLSLEYAFSAAITTYIAKVIKYSFIPDLQGEVKLDFSNTIKDFVTQNLEDVPECFPADDTVFDWSYTVGETFKEVFEFEDNFAATGSTVGFNNTTGTAFDVAFSTFKVGDQINIQQELFDWQYDDNYIATGSRLGFTSVNGHNYEVGDQVIVTGQETHLSYNGPVTIIDVPDEFNIVVDKYFISSTGAEPGSIFGTPKPEYNSVATITAIYYDAVLGFCIETNLGFNGSSQPIPGKITMASGESSDKFLVINGDDARAYNAHINKIDYSIDAFEPYINKVSSTFDENNLSTLLSDNPTYRNRIEYSTKSWLLCHNYLEDDNLPTFEAVKGATFKWYSSAGVLLSESFLENVSSNTRDFYIPIGIEQILDSVNVTSTVSLVSVLDQISYYEVFGSMLDKTPRTNSVFFELNDDCSRYEIYHLMWKDRYGSWISYPFKYISKDITEFERKTYYQTEGKWDLTNDTFGYDTFGRGEKSYFGRSRDKVILNSGWVNEEENILIKDLLESTSVYIQNPDNVLIGCIIQNKTQQFFKEESDYLWQYQFEVVLSQNENRF